MPFKVINLLMFVDFTPLYDLIDDNEKLKISNYIENCNQELSVYLANEMRRMIKFDFSEEMLKKSAVAEISLEELKALDQTSLLLNHAENFKLTKGSSTGIVNKKSEAGSETKQILLEEKIKKASNAIKKEDLIDFIYDLTSQNLSASSFIYAFRNLKNNDDDKEEYLLVRIQ